MSGFLHLCYNWSFNHISRVKCGRIFGRRQKLIDLRGSHIPNSQCCWQKMDIFLLIGLGQTRDIQDIGGGVGAIIGLVQQCKPMIRIPKDGRTGNKSMGIWQMPLSWFISSSITMSMALCFPAGKFTYFSSHISSSSPTCVVYTNVYTNVYANVYTNV